ncbi:MAG: hypothetical protein QM500_05270, partial [Methylococcales bacterium]
SSSANHPDLDWSQVRETVKLLTVSVSQVESNMHVGDESVTTLTDSFTGIVEHMTAINELLNTLEPSDTKTLALSHCQQTSDKIQTSIIAFQFYDRLQQSLSHVVGSLKGLSEIIESPERLYNPIEWKKFQDEIRGRYTMESEKVMFDAILKGKTVEEAIKLATLTDELDDEIELF